MPELTFKSAGVSAREIDLSGPTGISPSGTPAGIIGTALRGPAFVPVEMARLADFVAKFGETDGEKFGPLAVIEWLRNAQSVVYMRVLGAGDGKKKTTSGNNTGKVTYSGFVVGAEQVQANGNLAANPYTLSSAIGGRTYFLGCFMSQSAGSTVFTDAGIATAGQDNNGTSAQKAKHQGIYSRAHPIIRAVLMAPDEVTLMLSGHNVGLSQMPKAGIAATAAGPRGHVTGSVNIANAKQEFVMLINGHMSTGQYPNVITASFDVDAANHYVNVFNTDPLKVEEAGHYLYANYDIHPAMAVVTGTVILSGSESATHTGSLGVMQRYVATAGERAQFADLAFLTTGSKPRNEGASDVPNFENFETRYTHARSPWVISQKFGGNAKNLFKVHALSDGAYANDKFKISVANVAKSTSDTSDYGKFDLLVRDLYDTDSEKVILEQYRGLSLDPSSERYVARMIGDVNTYFDFEHSIGSQKIVVDGIHPNKSQYIRVEMSTLVDDGEIAETALPVGFRGVRHLVTSGTSALTTLTDSGSYHHKDVLKRAVQPPVPMRLHIKTGLDPKEVVNSSFYWGVQFMRQTDVNESNKSTVFDNSILAHSKYFPDFHTAWQNAWVGDNPGVADTATKGILDADRFNNNMFTLENIKVRTGSDGIADPKEWLTASYARGGGITPNESNKTRALSVDKDFGDLTVRKYAKFSFFLQGGFDGVNVFNKSKSRMLDAAAIREMGQSSQGETDGPTVAAYRKALDILEDKSDADIKLLAIPGIRHESITDYAINMVEDRFDALYIMDIEERDTANNVVTSSADQKIGVNYTSNRLKDRGLDTSFAAAYFPDVTIPDPFLGSNVRCPPSVAVLGAFSLNDSVAHPWFAPAGFTRGSLASTLEASVNLSRNNLDTLYEADINPLTAFPGSNGVVVWGQKTLLAAQSSLDRVNVRRLLIEIRRQVRQVSNQILFEPNRESTLAKFSGLVQPILQRVQDQSGLQRFKVVIDSTTTTQADVENNTVRGKIFLQPTRTIEFISLDFVVTNAGTEI